jgi:hypothetical protein
MFKYVLFVLVSTIKNLIFELNFGPPHCQILGIPTLT